MSDEKINVEIGASIGELIEGMRAGAEAVEGATLQMKGALAGLNEAFEAAMAPLVAFMAVLQGGKFLGEAISATVDMSKEATKLGRQLGISANEAGALSIAINKVHGTTEGYAAAATMLTRQIKNNEDGVKAMGVQTRNADGSLRNMQDIMVSAIDTLKGYKEGTDRNLAAQTLFGRGAANLGPILRLTSAAMEEAKAKQEELGLTITKEGQERVMAYRDAMTEANEVMEAVKVAIGNAVLPMFTALGEWFANNGVTIVNVFRSAMSYLGAVIEGVGGIIGVFWDGVSAIFTALRQAIDEVFGPGAVEKFMTFANALKVVQVGFALLKDYAQLVTDVIVTFVETTIAGITAWAQIVKALLALDFTAARAAWDGGMKAMEDRVAQGVNKMKADMAGVAPGIAALWNASAPKEHAADDKLAGGGKQYKAPDDTKEKDKTKILMDGLEHRLALMKEAALQMSVIDNQNHQLSIADEADYWAKQLQTAGLSLAAKDAIQKKYDAAHLSALSQRYAQEKAIGEAFMAGNQAAELANVDQRAALLDREVALGRVTNAQKIAAEQQFEAQRYAIQQAGFEARLAILAKDPTQGAAYAAMLNQKLALDAQYEAKKAALETQAQVESQKMLTTGINTVSQTWAQNLTKMATLQQGFAQTVQGMWQGMITAIANAFEQMLQQWLQQQLTALIMGKTQNTADALSKITANAGVAGSAAFASTAAIPITGPALAPAAAAAAVAGALSFAPMASAAGGFDIPSGVNPITQLHQREMVLPQQYADVIRGMAGGSGSGMGDIHVNVSAMDAHSFKGWLQNNGGGDVIMQHLASANRNFRQRAFVR